MQEDSDDDMPEDAKASLHANEEGKPPISEQEEKKQVEERKGFLARRQAKIGKIELDPKIRELTDYSAALADLYRLCRL